MRMFGRCVANGAGGTANSEFRSPNGFGTVWKRRLRLSPWPVSFVLTSLELPLFYSELL